MLRRSVVAAIISVAFACPSIAESYDEARPRLSHEQLEDRGLSREQLEDRADAVRVAQSLFDEVVSWICSNFDLPSTHNRPAIQFASKAELTRMRMVDRTHWQELIEEEKDLSSERSVVAVYNTISKTIFLPDNWIGRSVEDQSILVHEMVHHLQNLAKIRFECPAAREKVAYLAQDKWLARFGMSLEKEFEIDMFTVVVSSACM